MRLLAVVLVLFGIGGGSSQVILTKCPPNWVRWKDFCYNFINNATKQITWLQANNECVDLESHLLRIETRDEYDFVKKQLEQFPSYSDGYWTSLNILPLNQGFSMNPTFMWGSDSYPSPDLLQWEKGTDDFGNRHCVNIDMQAGIGFDDCNKMHGYICEVQRNSSEKCPDGAHWIGGPNMCYYVSDFATATLRNWQGARKICQAVTPFNDQRTARMLSIRQTGVQSFLASMLPKVKVTSQVYWTGLNEQTQGRPQWAGYSNPFDAQYVKWRQEPNDLGFRELCGAIKEGGLFADYSCRTRMNFICRVTLNTKPQFNHGCGAWIRAGHKCVYIHQTPRKSWTDARADCLGHGADLYKYSDEDDSLWLRTVAQKLLFLPGYYIGLNDRGSEGNYVWADGSASRRDLLNWDQEPNYHRDSSNRFCAVLLIDGTFSTRRCIRLHAGSICETAGTTCPNPWVSNGNRCYLFDTVMRTHDEARDNCKAIAGNATLLAINSQDEKNFITRQISSMQKVPFAFWTDLQKPTVADEWQYTVYDDSAMNYVTWSQQPNNYNNKEDCVQVDPYGYLNDVNCKRTAPYICQYDLSSGDQLQASLKITWLLFVACLVSSKLLG